MGFSKLILVGVGVGVSVAAALAGCHDTSDKGTGGSGGGSSSSSSSSSTTSTSTSSGACSPKASCTADHECLGEADNKGQTKFSLRMSELDLTKPVALTKGLIKMTVGGAVAPTIASCNLNGTGTFSWLLQFDKTAMTLKTGGALPVADITAGYDFDDQVITQGTQMFHIQPVTFLGVTPDASGKFSVAMGADLLMPIFLDATGTNVVLLPLKAARLINGTVSASQSCIGSYNAAGLDPASGCVPDDTHPPFLSGAALDGHLLLEDADTVTISLLQQSLCVLLSGDSTTFGDGAKPTAHCKRTGGVIDFKGDWCHATNAAADATCFDSVSLGANFAASAVKINN
jgi:hypothetical protein